MSTADDDAPLAYCRHGSGPSSSLQISSEPHAHPRIERRSLRFTLPLPNDIDTNLNLRFYGMAVSEQWLCSYARRQLPKDRRGSYNDTTLMNHAVRLLKHHTRIQTLTFELARFEPDVPPDTPTAEGAIMVISICAYTVESYNRRPSQQKVDMLSIIMEKSPRWWTDYVDASCYS